MHRRTRSFLTTSLIAGAALAPCAAHAAELGDARVSSHIGQQLVADIELTMLDDPATPVHVRLADPEVYSGAGVNLPPALSTLTLSVMRRDGRQFLHATTLRPVDADHLHLYLELSEHGQRAVRLATLWLTPDPNPAPVLPAPLPAPAPAAIPAVAAAPASAPMLAPRPARPAHVGAPARARVEAETAPPAAPAKPALPPPLPLHAAALPKIAGLQLHGAPQPAACSQNGEAQACVGLGTKNAELRARIGQLEERVKGLQARLGAAHQATAPVVTVHDAPKGEAQPAAHDAKPAAKPDAKAEAPHAAAQPAAAPPAVPPAAPPAQEIKPPPPPPGPKPISSIKPLVPHKPKAPPPDDGLPWGMLGAGAALLAAVGGAAALLKARAKSRGNVDIPAAPGRLATLRQRFFARNEAGAVADPLAEPVVEPTLD